RTLQELESVGRCFRSAGVAQKAAFLSCAAESGVSGDHRRYSQARAGRQLTRCRPPIEQRARANAEAFPVLPMANRLDGSWRCAQDVGRWGATGCLGNKTSRGNEFARTARR